jgi:hypothetical protein
VPRPLNPNRVQSPPTLVTTSSPKR